MARSPARLLGRLQRPCGPHRLASPVLLPAERDMTALTRLADAQVPQVHLILASATLRDALDRDVDHPWAGRHGWPLIEPVRRVLQIPFPGGGVVRVNEAPGIVDSWGYPPEDRGVTGPGYWSSAGTLAERSEERRVGKEGGWR